MQGEIVCLEDSRKSIESELEILEQRNLKSVVWERPFQTANYLEEKGRKPERIKGFLLDMHMDIPHLGEIQLPHVDTAGGEAVGLSFAEAYLRRPGSPYANTPLALLTGYSVQPKMAKRIHALNTQSAPVIVLRKGEDLVRFETFLARATELSNGRTLRPKDLEDQRAVREADFREGIMIASSMLARLGLSDREIATAFGFRPSSDDQLPALQALANQHLNVDLEDRIKLIIDIYARLKTIFGDNETARSEWLANWQEMLGHSTPLAVLKSAHLPALARLADILRRVTG